MKRFRRWRWRKAAYGLLPLTLLLTIAAATGTASAAPATTASIDANKSKTRTGKSVKLEGRFPAQPKAASGEGAGSESRQVRLQFKPTASKRGWRLFATTRQDSQGRYAERVRVRRTGYFRAVDADGRRTARERIRVRAKLRAKLRRRHVKIGRKVKVKGKVKPAIKRRRVVVRIGGEKLRTRTNRKGRFKVRWKADKTGRVTAKVKAKGDAIAAGDFEKAGRAFVYRPAQASYYGPGFYGNRTACGQTLQPSTMGVAHKTLPCGTRLRLRHEGRTVKVKVIDRGPYHGNREFDLTEATKRKLRFGSTGTVWTNK